MKYSDKCISMVKKFEGCVLTAYRCSAGVYTIGYGHTEGVVKGNVISQEKANEYLIADLDNAFKRVKKYMGKYNWGQNQIDALTSFSFNVNTEKSNIDTLTKNGTRTNSEIADALLLYNKAAGKVSVGLASRRQQERDLFVIDLVPTYAPHVQLNYKAGKNYKLESTMNVRTEPKEVNGKLVLGKKVSIAYAGTIVENLATTRIDDNILMCVQINSKQSLWIMADDGERCYVNEC